MKQKCTACGFDEEKESVCEREPWEQEKKFYEIEGHFTRLVQGNYSGYDRQEIYLYACPQCGTIRTDAI